MATKITGYVGDNSEQWLKDNFLGGVIFRKSEGVCELASTLVIHDGPHEPVYTASEVRAKLNAVDAMEHFTGAQVQMLAEYGFDVMGLHVPKADHHDPEGENT